MVYVYLHGQVIGTPKFTTTQTGIPRCVFYMNAKYKNPDKTCLLVRVTALRDIASRLQEQGIQSGNDVFVSGECGILTWTDEKTGAVRYCLEVDGCDNAATSEANMDYSQVVIHLHGQVVGNPKFDPTKTGIPRCMFYVKAGYKRPGRPTILTKVTAWRDQAIQLQKKGLCEDMDVILTGEVNINTWQDEKTGIPKYSLCIESADNITAIGESMNA